MSDRARIPFYRVVAPFAAAMIAAASAQAAETIYVDNVNLDPYFTDTVTVGDLGSGAAGLILLQTTDGQTLPVFCVDFVHDIYVGSYASNPIPYTFTTVTHDDLDASQPSTPGNGDPISAKQSGEIAALATIGYHDYFDNDPNPDDYAAIQAAIWQIEYKQTATSSNLYVNAAIQIFADEVENAPAVWATGLYPDEGQTQAFAVDPPAPVPEASTWTMMAIGFAGLGYAALHRARIRKPIAD